MKIVARIVCMVAISAIGLAQQVKVDGGTIAGSTAAGIASFKGIPFAQPPVGDLRWRAPQPVKPWSGVKQTTAYSADCMQVPFPLGRGSAGHHAGGGLSVR